MIIRAKATGNKVGLSRGVRLGDLQPPETFDFAGLWDAVKNGDLDHLRFPNKLDQSAQTRTVLWGVFKTALEANNAQGIESRKQFRSQLAAARRSTIPAAYQSRSSTPSAQDSTSDGTWYDPLNLNRPRPTPAVISLKDPAGTAPGRTAVARFTSQTRVQGATGKLRPRQEEHTRADIAQLHPPLLPTVDPAIQAHMI